VLPPIEFRWKRLWPDENRGGNTKAKVKKFTFEEFAQSSFKVNQLYAKQALAILNFSPELLEDAKSGLAEAYKVYQARAAEEGKAATKKVTKISLHRNGANGTRCRWNQGWSD
jgi:hypothetical protein